jgi:hypothetical protein
MKIFEAFNKVVNSEIEVADQDHTDSARLDPHSYACGYDCGYTQGLQRALAILEEIEKDLETA